MYISNLISLFRVAQISPPEHYNLTAKRSYEEVDKGEEEPHLNSKQRKLLKFQKRFQRKSCQ